MKIIENENRLRLTFCITVRNYAMMCERNVRSTVPQDLEFTYYITWDANASQNFRWKCRRNLDNPDYAMQYGRPLYQHWVKAVALCSPLSLFSVPLKSRTSDIVQPAQKLFLCFHAQTTT